MPSAVVQYQTWYRPTDKEWYVATATGTGGWQRIMGNVSALDIITEAYIADAAIGSAKIKNLEVGTIKIADNSISLLTQSYNASTRTSAGWSYEGYVDEEGNWVEPYDARVVLTSHSVYFEYPGTLYVWGKVKQSFPRDGMWFECSIRVNGEIIDDTLGGGSKQDGVPLLAKYAASAGQTLLVELCVQGDFTITYAAGKSKLMSDRRYK